MTTSYHTTTRKQPPLRELSQIEQAFLGSFTSFVHKNPNDFSTVKSALEAFFSQKAKFNKPKYIVCLPFIIKPLQKVLNKKHRRLEELFNTPKPYI